MTIKETLDILWELRNSDKFYFYAYGKECLEELLKQQTKQDHRSRDIS